MAAGRPTQAALCVGARAVGWPIMAGGHGRRLPRSRSTPTKCWHGLPTCYKRIKRAKVRHGDNRFVADCRSHGRYFPRDNIPCLTSMPLNPGYVRSPSAVNPARQARHMQLSAESHIRDDSGQVGQAHERVSSRLSAPGCKLKIRLLSESSQSWRES